MKNNSSWSSWARFLQHWGLHKPVAIILEAAGPLTLLFAQMVYFSRPFVGWNSTTGELEALAQMLENPEESRSFATFLRGEGEK